MSRPLRLAGLSATAALEFVLCGIVIEDLRTGTGVGPLVLPLILAGIAVGLFLMVWPGLRPTGAQT